MSFTLHGLAVSGGIAIGQAHLVAEGMQETALENFLPLHARFAQIVSHRPPRCTR